MRCSNCNNFKRNVRLEAGKEISPDFKSNDGICDVNNKNCKANDSCNCGGFCKK